MPTSTSKRQALDPGPAQRASHNKLVPELTGRGYEFRVRVKDQTVIDQLLQDEIITADQYITLERFSGDLYKAGFIPLRAQNFEPSTRQGSGINLSEDAVLKKLVVGQAIKRLDSQVGVLARQVLMRVCLDEGPVAKNHLRIFLRAIEELDGFYGN